MSQPNPSDNQRFFRQEKRDGIQGLEFLYCIDDIMNVIKVVMLGPSLRQQGGMATVENLIVNYPSCDIDISHISTHEEGSILHRLIVFTWAVVQLLGRLLQGSLDVLHLHVAERGSVARISVVALLGFLLRKPVIMHAHGCEFHLFYDRLFAPGRQFVSFVLRHCTCVIVLSDNWKRYYVAACNLDPDRVVVLHNPVELPKRLPNRTKASHVQFVFLGRLGYRKGAYDLVQAFSCLPAECQSRSQLVLAGDGEVESVRQLAQSLDLQEQVHLPGWINTEQRNQILAQSDVFILPSYNEGLPVALLEAMAWGLPVITTPVGGIPEMVKHQQNGILVCPGEVDQIVDAMQVLIENQAFRLSLGQAARRQVASLGIDRYFNRLQSLYQATLTDRSFLVDSSSSQRSLTSTRQ